MGFMCIFPSCFSIVIPRLHYSFLTDHDAFLLSDLLKLGAVLRYLYISSCFFDVVESSHFSLFFVCGEWLSGLQ